MRSPAQVGGYVGVYHKGRKRRARTGQQPLACVPPLGDDAPGVFVEAAFRCVDPRGLKKEGAPVKKSPSGRLSPVLGTRASSPGR